MKIQPRRLGSKKMDITTPIRNVTNLAKPPAKPSGRAKNRRRRTYSLIVGGNVLLLAIIAGFLIVNRSASQTVRNSLATSAVSTASSQFAPLDQISSAAIALESAQATQLPELTAIRNQAQSEILLLSTVPNDSTALVSPQIVSTSEKSRYQISFYKVKPGDTASTIAAKFHLTLNSITASNGLNGDFVTQGSTLAIPPGNGVVYKVQSGDTVSSIVSAYGADKSLFIAVNDAEKGVYTGEYVWIPNVGGTVETNSFSSFYSFSGFTPIYGYNGYDFGTCTWYVASQISVPTNWGDAYTWGPGARASGWNVSLTTPTVGSIAWANSSAGFGYFGHVAIVTAVSADGTQIKYSDMNDPYYDVVTQHDWAPASIYTGYITR